METTTENKSEAKAEKERKAKIALDKKELSLDVKINNEIYKAIERLGGQSDILSAIGSRYDTMTDIEVLAALKAYNSYINYHKLKQGVLNLNDAQNNFHPLLAEIVDSFCNPIKTKP